MNKNKLIVQWNILKNRLYFVKSLLLLLKSYLLQEREKIIYHKQKIGFYGKNAFNKSIMIFSNAGGEISGTDEFLRRLKKEHPDHSIIITVENFDAMNIAKNVIKNADGFIFFPYDLKQSTKRFLKYTNPKMVLFFTNLFRTEIINQCYKLGSITGIVGGLFRDPLLLKKGALECLKRMIANDVFKKISFFAMMTDEDYKKISEFIEDKNKIYTLGFIKFDLTYAKTDEEGKKSLMKEYHVDKNETIIIAGATNYDEEVILDAYKDLENNIKNLKLIIVPRWPTRISEIEKLILKKGFKYTKKSQLHNKNYKILIIDTNINLAKLYSIGTVNILGRSFVPFEKVAQGGGNIFEAAIHGKPTFFGTNMSSWKEYSTKILKEFPQLEAKDAKDLSDKILRIFKNKKKEYQQIGEFMKEFTEKEVVEKQKKILEDYLHLIKNYMRK